jgi:hypothetical protein
MTQFYYRKKKAGDLLLGDLFVDWAIRTGENSCVYGPPCRVLNIIERAGRVYVDLDNLSRQAFYPEQLVVVKERA